MIYKILFVFLLVAIVSCTSKLENLKYDARGKVIVFNIGKQDTIFFAENSFEIDSLYSESLILMSNFVKQNNHKVFLKANTHEDENKNITNQRLNEIENYFLLQGLNKEQIIKNTKVQIVPISEDDILTEDEKKPVRRVIIQIIK